MVRFQVRVTVHEMNEEKGTNTIDFPYTKEGLEAFKNEIEFSLNGKFFVDNEGRVFKLSVSNIVEI